MERKLIVQPSLDGTTYPPTRGSFKDMKKFRSDANVLMNTKYQDKYSASRATTTSVNIANIKQPQTPEIPILAVRRSSSEPVIGSYDSSPSTDTTNWAPYDKKVVASSPPKKLHSDIGQISLSSFGPPQYESLQSPRFEWEISEEQKEHWLRNFKKLAGKKSTTSERKLGKDLETFLPDKETVKRILKLADEDGDTRFSEDEFLIAKFLAYAASQKQTIPESLPMKLRTSFVFKLRTGTLENSDSSGNEGEEIDPAVPVELDDLVYAERPVGRVILSGTPKGFIKALAMQPQLEYGHEYTQVLILTHTHFISSEELLATVFKTYSEGSLTSLFGTLRMKKGTMKIRESAQKINLIFQLRAVNFIKKWIEMQPHKFAEGEPLRASLEEFIIKMANSKNKTDEECSKLLTSGLKFQPLPLNLDNAPKPILPKTKGLFASIVQIDALELARQITIIDHKLVRAIKVEELIKKQFEKDRSKAPAVVAFNHRMDQMCNWVASELVLTPDLKQRTAVLARMLEVANHLLELRNFCSLMAIYLALSMAPIERLKRTWKSLSSKHTAIWQNISTILDPMRNFKALRKLWNESEYEPRIPVPTILQKDIIFIEDGNPNVGKCGLINFEKIYLLGKTLHQLYLSQELRYHLVEVPSIQEFLLELLIIPAKEISEQAKKCEPSEEMPVSSSGKDTSTRKTLKNLSALFSTMRKSRAQLNLQEKVAIV